MSRIYGDRQTTPFIDKRRLLSNSLTRRHEINQFIKEMVEMNAESWVKRIGRRSMLKWAGLAAIAPVVAACQPSAESQATATAVGRDLNAARQEILRLSYNTASGGGTNVKMMPDPKTGQPTVPLEEIFSFDRNYAFCLVYTNPQAFKMGEVVIDANKFYMYMITNTIDQYELTTLADGSRQVIMRGGLSCKTEVEQATVTIGSRTIAEHATYKVTAIDKGVGGGNAGDSFAFTAFFDEKDAPINYGIFGAEATFTGKMTQGEITILDPKKP